jgi:hypothetical protein
MFDRAAVLRLRHINRWPVTETHPAESRLTAGEPVGRPVPRMRELLDKLDEFYANLDDGQA